MSARREETVWSIGQLPRQCAQLDNAFHRHLVPAEQIFHRQNRHATWWLAKWKAHPMDGLLIGHHSLPNKSDRSVIEA